MKRKVQKTGYFLLFILGLILCVFASSYSSWVEDGLLDDASTQYLNAEEVQLVARVRAKMIISVLQKTQSTMPDQPEVLELIATLHLYLACDWIFWTGVVLAGVMSVVIFGMSGSEKNGRGGRTRFDTKRTALCGVLLSLMLILGWVERQIPLPHGIKLGLSNSVLIFAVYMLDVPTAFVLMVYKVFLSNLLFGNLGTTFMMGFAGGLLSLTAMVLISRIKGMHPVTVSIVGGVCHNVGQVIMAIWLMENVAMVSLLPWLILSGLFFGAMTGIVAHRTMRHLKHMRF